MNGRQFGCLSWPLSEVAGMVDVEVIRPLTVCTWSPLTRTIEMDMSWVAFSASPLEVFLTTDRATSKLPLVTRGEMNQALQFDKSQVSQVG